MIRAITQAARHPAGIPGTLACAFGRTHSPGGSRERCAAGAWTTCWSSAATAAITESI